MAEATAASGFAWDSTAEHYDKILDDVDETFQNPTGTSSSSSDDGQGDELMSPRPEEDGKKLDDHVEVCPSEDNETTHDQSDSQMHNSGNGESKPETTQQTVSKDDTVAVAETNVDIQPGENSSSSIDKDAPTEDVGRMRQSSVHRRMTYIGEGLLDVGGMDAIDRLSDLSSYSDLEKQSSADQRAETAHHASVDEAQEVADTSAHEVKESSSESVVTQASGNKLLAFLAKGSEKSKVSSPPAPKPVTWPLPPTTPVKTEAPVDAVSPPESIENRRTKLLDFLANDIGERYLDGVYQDEARSKAEEDEEDAVDESEQDRQRRARLANNKLRAFLAKEKGERLHGFERGSDEGKLSQRSSFSSVASSASSTRSSEARPKPKEPSKLLDFVAKIVPEKPKFVIFNPADAVSQTEELEHLVAEEAQKKKKKREDREKARQKVMSFLAEEGASDRNKQGSVSTIKSVDESKVQRETVVDRYGRVGLLDFLDRTEAAQQQKIRWATSRHSSESSLSPSSSHSSSPKTAASPERSTAAKDPVSPPSASSRPAHPNSVSPPPASNRPANPSNRLASFLSKITSKHAPSVPSEKKASPHHSPVSSLRAEAPSVPKSTAGTMESAAAAPVSASGAHSEAPLDSEDDSSKSGSHQPSAKMAPVLSTLDHIAQTCAKHELNDVSIARITTLLTSISQIVREDMQKGQRPVRRWSNVSASPTAASSSAPSWIKSGKEIEEFDKKHASIKSASAPVSAVEGNNPSLCPAMLESRSSDVKVASSVVDSFNEFEGAQNLLEVVATFHKLLTDCGLTDLKLNQPWSVYDHVKSAVGSKLGFRQKQLFKLLDAKLGTDVYRKRPAAHKRVCIIGAGPVGLRAAVEMSLLGAQVVVLEKRKHFSRENILHLWPWVVQDLTSLGAKVFFPQFCHSTAYFHVGTRQLQCILLKVALLLGVTFFPATAFEGLASPDSIETGRRPYYTVLTKPQIPWMEFTAVLGASGTQDKLSEQSGIKRFVFSRKEAIGLVCYFPNHGTAEEKNVAEFSWTIQFKQQMFAKMREIGVDLENIVYYRGEMHYVVMTPKRENLLEQGVLKLDYPNVADLVMDDNIDKPVLHEYLKRVVKFVNIPKKSDFARVRVFDFSSRTRADKAASILTSKGKKLYVGLIGDSLMEPFWPEGLGTCRGFLSALDGCWMVAQVGFNSDEQILADRELAYRIIQHVSGFRRDDLQKNVRKYNVDPKTRYVVKFPQLC